MKQRFSLDLAGRRFFSGLCAAFLMLGVAGCEDNENDYEDYTPPAGKGSLVIDNFSADDVYVYVNGLVAARVDDGDYEIVDLAPGRYTILLDEDDGSRDSRVDVEILNGRRTVLRVAAEAFGGDYNVDVDYD